MKVFIVKCFARFLSLTFPFPGLIRLSDSFCHLCACFEVVNPITIVEKQVFIGIIVHSLRGSAGPEPISEKIPPSAVPFEQVVFHVGIEECQPAFYHFEIIFQNAHITFILIHKPRKRHHNSAPGRAAAAVIRGRRLRQNSAAEFAAAAFLFVRPVRVVHIADHRFGSLHVAPVFEPFVVKCAKLVIKHSGFGCGVCIAAVTEPFALRTIHDVSAEGEVFERPVHGVVNPVLQRVGTFKRSGVGKVGANHPSFDVFFFGSRFQAFYRNPSA